MPLPTPTGFWKMDDAASAGATDETTNALTFTKNGTIGSTTGKIGNCRTLDGTSTNYFNRASETALQSGPGDWTMGGWFYLPSSTPTFTHACVMARAAPPSSYEYLLFYLSSGVPRLQIWDNTASNGNNVDWSGALNDDAWHFLLAWHDSSAAKIKIQADNGTPVEAARTVTLTAGTADLQVGRYDTASYPWYGRMDELIWYKGIYDSTQRTSLYNAGAGRTWSQAAGWGDTSGAAPRSKVVSQALSNSVNW